MNAFQTFIAKITGQTIVIESLRASLHAANLSNLKVERDLALLKAEVKFLEDAVDETDLRRFMPTSMTPVSAVSAMLNTIAPLVEEGVKAVGRRADRNVRRRDARAAAKGPVASKWGKKGGAK